LDEAWKSGALPKQKYYRFKNKLRDIALNPFESKPEPDIMEELDKKIDMAVKYYR